MYFRQRIRVNRHIFLPFEKEEVYNQIKICFVDEFIDLGKYKFVPQQSKVTEHRYILMMITSRKCLLDINCILLYTI